MTTIHSDVATEDFKLASNESETDFDGAAAFLSAFEKDEDASTEEPSEEGNDDEGVKSSDNERDSTDDEDGSDASDESPEDNEADDEDGDVEKKYVDSDETYVKVKVGDDEHEVAVKDLKRLYGQEAALTRKSQEVAEVRKTADATVAKHLAALNVMIERAKERANPFRTIDWALLSKDNTISGEEFSALRSQAQEALQEEQFLTQSLEGFMGEIKKEQEKVRVAEVQATIKALTTPGTDDKPNPLHIEGWNDKLYDDIRAFGVTMGAPVETMNSITDAVSIKVLHMAMQFAKGAKDVKTEKVVKQPKKIVKRRNSPTAMLPTRSTDRKAALANQRKRGGDTESTVAAFLAGLDGGDE